MSIEGAGGVPKDDLERQDRLQKEIDEHIEQYVEEFSEENYYFSVDTREVADNHVRVSVYGLEDYELPSQDRVAEAVGNFMNWVPGYEEETENDENYTIRIIDFEDGGSVRF